MTPMPSSLPPEFFREGAAAVPEAAEPADRSTPGGARPPAPPRRRLRDGVAPRLVIAGVLGALLLGFGVGRLLLLEPGGPGTVTLTPSATGQPTASSTASPVTTLVPYDGAVAVVPALAAQGQCEAAPSREQPSNLLDEDPETFWRCRGAGVGETITFTLDPASPVVGVRLVNGNTVWPDRYIAERRILAIKWTFEDGSWVVQGLAANDRQPQEVRFPPVNSATVTMEVVSATVPGGTEDLADAVSIASLDFLTVA